MKQRVFVTGAIGGMGFASLKEILQYSEEAGYSYSSKGFRKEP